MIVIALVALLGALVPIGATFLLLQSTRWDRDSEAAALVLLIALAVGLGLGFSSCAYFLALAIADGARVVVVIIDLLFLTGAVAIAWQRGVFRPDVVAKTKPPPATERRRAITVAVLVAAVAAVALNTIGNPHGEWDAWAIWNLRARWLFRGGPAWHSAFTEDAIHGDYPLLLPAAVARLWAYAGADLPAIPGALGAAYAGALVLLLYGSLATLRGRTIGLLATLCLLGTPIFLRTVAWQYADIPFAFAMLATLALLAARDHDPACGPSALVWSGVAAGLAAWTKNEGLLLVVCIAGVRAALALARRTSLRPAVWFVAGLLPGAATVVAFKAFLAPPTYQFAGREMSQLLAQLGDPSRYGVIASAVRGAALRDAGRLLLALVIYIALLGRTRDEPARRAAAAAALVTVLVAFGYVGAYLTTPADLVWQLAHSLDRLLLQLWPYALFAFWLCAAGPAELAERAPAGRASKRRAKSSASRARHPQPKAAGGRARLPS